jgi:hypothetical protein
MKSAHFVLFLSLLPLFGCGSRKESLSKILHVSMRSSALSASEGVLQLENRSDEPLVLLGIIRNLDNNQEKAFATGTLQPSQRTEFGRLEIGWTFEPNEQITLLKPDSKSTYAIYETFRAENGTVGIRAR